VALAGFVTAGALPAAAAPSTVDYVALGDSYAAGTAAPGSFPACPHGDGGYPALLADGSESRISLTTNAACSGATISEVASKQLSALDRHTRLVTLTVGAANLGLSRVLDACTNPQTPDACRAEIGRALALVQDCSVDEGTLGGDLIELYGKVAKAAPGARIVVTGYPLLFEPPAANDPDRVAKTAINKATTDLNCVIKQAVEAAANEADVNMTYVDVTEEFATHGIVDPRSCTGSSAFIHSLLICKPDPVADLEAFHPTAAGYAAYADAISAALPRGWLNKQEPLA
jgi:lysophospholipase L1-like esterase